MAIENLNKQSKDFEVKIANVKLELKGGNKNQKWVDWLKVFAANLDRQNDWKDEKKKAYLTGLIDKIKVNYDKQKNEHELTIHFKLPIVNDSHTWNDRLKKKDGYEIHNGVHTSTLTVKKKEGRWSKIKSEVTP